ncbi:hypothetical protein [Pseudotenacibaculum haliotis]|uniref:DNA-directed RNA polymerase n=1 Tax=Pseudotenacibaculum haliotis TaxID=1862138 RepID=A0ABW5LRH3_9FLAO
MEYRQRIHFKKKKRIPPKALTLFQDMEEEINNKFMEDDWITLYSYDSSKFCSLTVVTTKLIPSNLRNDFLKNYHQIFDNENLESKSIQIVIHKQVDSDNGGKEYSYEISEQFIRNLKLKKDNVDSMSTTYYGKDLDGKLEPVLIIRPLLNLVCMKMTHLLTDYMAKNNLELAISFYGRRSTDKPISSTLAPFEKTIKTEQSIHLLKLEQDYDSRANLFFRTDITGRICVNGSSIKTTFL